jgi:uncharacterized protein (TIGR02270 family)
MVLHHIVALHAEDAAFLWLVRDRAARAPHYKLRDLARLDDRLQAHTDGLRIAGEAGWELAEAQLESKEPGEMFAAMVLALEMEHCDRATGLLELAETAPSMRRGLGLAFAWLPWRSLQSVARKWLDSGSPILRWAGLMCHAAHGADPEHALPAAMDGDNEMVRARALRSAGELGRRDLIQNCRRHTSDSEDSCRFWASWSSVLLGDSAGGGLSALKSFCLHPNAFRECAFRTILTMLPLPTGRQFLESLANEKPEQRLLIRGMGIVGDPCSIPLLIGRMEHPDLARLAGESFALITGVDIGYENLKRKPPADFESGPTDDADDENVGMDADADLPWPDPEKIHKWWDANRGRFAKGRRYFCGQIPDAHHLLNVVREGYQPQRAAAALSLALLHPGSRMFSFRAPGWVQKQKLS